MKPYWSDKDLLAAGQRALPKCTPDQKLLGYLEKYQQDLLTTSTPEGLPGFATQRDTGCYHAAEVHAAGHGYHQTISGRGTNLPKFWELMFSMDFVSHETELVNNVGYDDREIAAGIRSTIEAPYAEFTIIDESLRRVVAQTAEPAMPPARIVTVRQQVEPTTREAEVFLRGRLVCVTIAGDKAYTIKRLGENPVLLNGQLEITTSKWLIPVAQAAKSIRAEIEKVRTLAGIDTKSLRRGFASKMVRVKRIELSSQPWEGCIIAT